MFKVLQELSFYSHLTFQAHLLGLLGQHIIIFCPDFATNSREEWRLSLFNQICENKLENCWKFWNLWKLFNIIIKYYSFVSLNRLQAAAPSIDPMKWEQEEVERENLKVRSSFQSLFSPVLEGIRTIRVTDWKMRISWLGMYDVSWVKTDNRIGKSR